MAVTSFSCADADDKELDSLVRRFQGEPFFFRQFDIGQEIVERADPRAPRMLESWLKHEDRHIRGNVGFIYAKFGDPRGLATIVGILDDYSGERRVEWQGGSLLSGTNESPEQAMERFLRSPGALRAQIKTDRYYAVHLLGELRDAHAVDVLLPLLTDASINYKVAWALGEIQDERAIAPLIAALRNSDALVRTSTIHALVKLRATEAVPNLQAMLSDTALPSAGPRTSVGQTALEALETLQNELLAN
jgi:HEAT repeat protein